MESQDHSLLRLIRMSVFSEVNATISPEFLDTIAGTDLFAFLENLDAEHEIGYEVYAGSVGLDGRLPCIIRGNLDQIILAKIKLESAVIKGFSDGVGISQSLSTPMMTTAEDVQMPSSETAAKFCNVICSPPTDHDASAATIPSRRKRGRPRKVRLADKRANLQIASNNAGNKFHQNASIVPQSADVMNNNNNNNNNNNIDGEDENDGSVIVMDVSKGRGELDDEIDNIGGDADANARASSADTHHRKDGLNDRGSQSTFKYDCELCSFTTDREGQLLKHVLVHGKSNAVYKCDKCCFASVSRNHFKRHRMHHMDSLLHCPQCSFETDDTTLLSRHVAVRHTMQLVRDVVTCSPNMSDADVHKLIARSSKMQCNECGYSTAKIYHFERHLLVHNRDLKGLLQVYQCEECNYKTHRKEHYIRHKENVHVGQKTCGKCGFTCRTSSALLRHSIAVHDEKPATLAVATTSKPTVAISAGASADVNEEDFSGQLAASCVDVSLSVPSTVDEVCVKSVTNEETNVTSK